MYIYIYIYIYKYIYIYIYIHKHIYTRCQVVAKRLAWAKCFNAGQTCMAPDYVLVHQDQVPLNNITNLTSRETTTPNPSNPQSCGLETTTPNP